MEWQFPYPSFRVPLLAANCVTTTQPLAAQAGLAMLARGGSAVDAAVATAITLTVVEPVMNGIGGDAFAIVWDGGGLHGLNASGRSPAAWTAERFAGLSTMPDTGWDTVTVPGAVSAWIALHQRFGRLPFEVLFEAAIGYARDGFLVSPRVAKLWQNQVERLGGYDSFAETFLPHGRAPLPGEHFCCLQQATTLEAIAASSGEAFYRGHLAEAIAAAAAKDGGGLSLDDLATHAPEWVAPLSVDFRGYRVHELPPNGQGLAALIGLGILEPVRPRYDGPGPRRSPSPRDRSDQARHGRRRRSCCRSRRHDAPGRGAACAGLPRRARPPDRSEAGNRTGSRKTGGPRHGLPRRRRTRAA